MILFFLHFLSDRLGIKVPAAFSYSSTRMVLAAITTLVFTIFLGPWFIKKLYALKTGQSIRVEDCPMLAELHQKKKDTPTMGGILILLTMIFSLFLWMDLKSPFTLILLITTLCLGGIGAYDDYLKLKHKNSKGLKSKKKFYFQILIAAILGLYLLVPSITESLSFGKWFRPPVAKEYVSHQEAGRNEGVLLNTQEYVARYYLPFVKDSVCTLKGAGLIVGFLMIIFVITGSSNEVNLTDFLDGLASGCLVMTSLVLSLVAFLSNHTEIARYLNILYIEGSGEIAIYLCALSGACLGFLWYNGYPAQIFMGDTGSLALGGIIGISAILLRREVLLAIIGGIFVAEALSVILQVANFKLRHGKRIFLCSPLHHHFEYKGWPETKVVLRFWIISLILAMIGIASLKLQ
ncbi:MAG: phospho-N-acetylmuramoyl-pentapeptide-transferase [Anaerolineae bacterium]